MRVLALVCLLLLISACGATVPSPVVQPSATTSPTPSPTLQPTVTSPPPTPTAPRLPTATTPPIAVQQPSTPVPGGSEMVIQLAVADLAARVRVAAGDIMVKSVEAVNWPDTALGCPQPGQMYAQVITPGNRIILTAAGKDYEYHSDRNRVIPCQSR